MPYFSLLRTLPTVVGILLILMTAVFSTDILRADSHDTPVKLVSNTGQTLESGASSLNLAQQFTTGSNEHGYVLTEVRSRLASVQSNTTRTYVTINSDSNGSPGSVLASLSNPDRFARNSSNTFTLSTGLALAKETKYWIVFNAGVSRTQGISVSHTASTDEDSDSLTGWSIANSSRWRNQGDTGWSTGASITPIEIHGYADGDPDDATLSNISLTDRDGGDIALTPTFDPATTSYTATVDNTIQVMTATTSKGYGGASFKYLDADENDLSDADTAMAGHQVSLESGANTLKVEVTSSGETETETYTVVVTRLDDSLLVRSTGLSSPTALGIGSSQNGAAGQRFTTGSRGTGYSLSSVGVFVVSKGFSESETITARIHEFEGSATNDLGSLIATLDTPALTEGEVNFFDAPADTTLDPDTEYILNFHSTGDSGNDLEIQVDTSDEQAGAAGWLIQNDRRSGGGLSGTGRSMVIEVRGDAITSTDATLRSLELTDSSSNAVSITPAFTEETTSYVASVDNAVGEITVVASKTVWGAALEYLDENDEALADADDETDGHQVSLESGNNTFKMQVTAENESDTRTYTVSVNRAAWNATLTVRDLEDGNLGCDNDGEENLKCSDSGTLSEDEFTFGDNDYTIRSVILTSEGELRLWNIGDWGHSSWQRFTFHVSVDGSSQSFPFADAGDDHGAWIRNWENSGLTWTAGSDVELKITDDDTKDALLSDLQVTDSDGTAIVYSPSVSLGLKSMISTVGNDVAQITLVATTNADGATVAYLDDSGNAIDDADTATDGMQVPLTVGSNIIKVRGTAKDEVTEETYTLRILRAAAAPSPIDGDELLHANLSVGPSLIGEYFGYGNNVFGEVSGHLTDSTFSFDGTDYSIASLTYYGDSEWVSICISPVVWDDALDDLSLVAGDQRFFFDDADSSLGCFRWDVPSHMRWAFGDIVEVKISGPRILVSNLDKSTSEFYGVGGAGSKVGQKFTTGSGNRFRVTEIVVAKAAGAGMKVAIHEPAGGGSNPGSTALYTFTPPGSSAAGERSFTAPADAILEPDKTYFIVITAGSDQVDVRTTLDDGEDSTSLSGWSIANTMRYFSSFSSTWGDVGHVAEIAVRGTFGKPISDDASLASLELFDSDDNAIEMTPSFTPTTSHVVTTVDNDVEWVTIAATPNHYWATTRNLDDAGDELPDSRDGTDGYQVDLSDGKNTFQVEVTASDESTTETYTILVVRTPSSTSLVSNAHLATDSRVYVGNATAGFGTQGFTTGSNPDGYVVDSIDLSPGEIDFSRNETLRLRIHEFDDSKTNKVGDRVASLVTPSRLRGNTISFTAPSNVVLKPDTKYLVVLIGTGNAQEDMELLLTNSNGQTGASGWSIENAFRLRGRLHDAGNSIKMTVRGYENPASLANYPAEYLGTRAWGAAFGPAQVGRTITFNTDDVIDNNGLSDPGYTYKWTRMDSDGSSNPVVISGATSSSYTVTSEDLGKTLKLDLSFVDDAKYREGFSIVTNPVVPQAADCGDDELWCATMTVGYGESDEGNAFRLGFARRTDHLNEEFGELSDSTFTHNDVDYTVTAIYVSTGSSGIGISTNPNLPADGAGLVLRVQRVKGEISIPMSDLWFNESTGRWSSNPVFGSTPGNPSLLRTYLRSNYDYKVHTDEGIKLRVRLSTRNNDATLSSLEIAAADAVDIHLAPEFSPAVAGYATSVAADTDAITVAPKTTDENASVKYTDENGDAIADSDSNTPGKQISLDEGVNEINVVVTAEDGETTQTYTIGVSRGPLASNTHLEGHSTFSAGNLENGELGQTFTTGINTFGSPRGFDLYSVGIHLDGVNFSGDETLTVRLYIFDDSKENDQGELVATLVSPEALNAGEVNTFSAPGTVYLRPETTYLVSLHTTGDSADDLRVSRVSANAQKGWDIGNAAREDGEAETYGRSVQIDVRAAHRLAFNTDTTLSSLALADADDAQTIAISPAFDSGTTSYTTSVTYSTDVITVSATTGHPGASVAYLDTNSDVITDADTATDGQQVSLAGGTNTITVRVTAEDAESTASYTVDVDRPAEANTDATLSALALAGGGGNLGIDLTPAFDPEVTSYTVSVIYSIEEITLSTDSAYVEASIEILDGNGDAIADGDTDKDGHQVALEPGVNTITVTVTAEDEETTASYTIEVTRAAEPSTDATLGDLALIDSAAGLAIALTPAFDSATTSYTASANYSAEEITIAPATSHVAAVVEFLDGNDAAVADADTAVDGHQVSLDTGANTITVRVTAEDEETTVSYAVEVTRAAEASTDATLSDLMLNEADSGRAIALSPEFASSTNSYTASANYSADEITLTPTTGHSGASVEFLDGDDDAIADSDTAADGQQISLETGANTIKMQVTAEDGETTASYTVEVTRAEEASTDATLDNLTVADSSTGAGIALSPAFASGTTSYTASVNFSTVEVSLSPVAAHSGASVEFLDDNDSTLADSDTDKDGQQVSLDAGANTLKVQVTAEDGETTVSYTVEVTRPEEASDDATLSALKLTDTGNRIALRPGFSSATTSYAASVDNGTEEITISATVSHEEAEFDFLDSSDESLNDANTSREGHQVSLAVGSNTVKVRVTAEDDETTQVYTITVERAEVSVQRSVSLPADNTANSNTADSNTDSRVSFGASTYSVTEGGTVDIRINLSPAPDASITIPLTVTDHGGASSDDYSGVPNSVTFASGETQQTFTFSAVSDEESDAGEQVSIVIGELPDGVVAGTNSQTTISITNRGLVVSPTSLAIEEYLIGDTVGTGTFTVRLSMQPEANVTVSVSSDDTAAAFVSTDTLTFTSQTWDSSQTVTVTAVEDSDGEDEDVTISLTADGYAPASVAVTVNDPDVGTPQ